MPASKESSMVSAHEIMLTEEIEGLIHQGGWKVHLNLCTFLLEQLDAKEITLREFIWARNKIIKRVGK